MKRVFCYLLLISAALTYCLFVSLLGKLPVELEPLKVGLMCAIIGGLGGCIYCFRGVYLNACVLKQWSDVWLPWYFIRPLVSIACGAVSYLFLRAGLLVLESGTRADSSDLGFFALSFVAGLNVDKFIAKIEDIAQAVWGIEKSRAISAKSQEGA